MRVHVGVARLEWEPEVESGDDGYVKQTTFIASANRRICPETHELLDLPATGIEDYDADGLCTTSESFIKPIPKGSQLEDGVLLAPEAPDPMLTKEQIEEWQNDIIGCDPECIIEDIAHLYTAGHQPKNLVGHRRKLACVQCMKPVHSNISEFSACSRCNGFVCIKCRPEHDDNHLSQTLALGLTKRAVVDTLQAKRRRKEAEAAPPAPDPDFEALHQFWRTRDTNNEDMPQLRAGDQAQGESSEEEGLPPSPECSGCGSMYCRLEAKTCRKIGKASAVCRGLVLLYGGDPSMPHLFPPQALGQEKELILANLKRPRVRHRRHSTSVYSRASAQEPGRPPPKAAVRPMHEAGTQ